MYTYSKASGVHHDEHVFKASVLLSHQKPFGAASIPKLHHCSRRSFDAQFVLQAHTIHVISLTQQPIVQGHEFGNKKQADAFDPRRSPRDTGQHHVHNVAGQVVLTKGDVDFGAKDFVGSICPRLSPGSNQRQIGASLWLGQIHGPTPFTTDQAMKVGLFLSLRASSEQSFNGTVGEQRTQCKA